MGLRRNPILPSRNCPTQSAYRNGAQVNERIRLQAGVPIDSNVQLNFAYKNLRYLLMLGFDRPLLDDKDRVRRWKEAHRDHHHNGRSETVDGLQPNITSNNFQRVVESSMGKILTQQEA